MALKQPKYQIETLALNLRLCLAFINVARQRVYQQRWLPITAAEEMGKSEPWMESTYAGSTSFHIWKDAKTSFKNFQHERSKAPLLSWDDLMSLADSCVAKRWKDSRVSLRRRQLFWLGVMTCSRIGNLSGLIVQNVTPESVTFILVEHKTAAKVNQMSLTLPYWNSVMKEHMEGLATGPATIAEMNEIADVLQLDDVRKHSIRRTSCNVYADCGVPLEDICAITKHTTTKALKDYLGHYAPIKNPLVPSGMAISHAPNIWKTLKTEVTPTLAKLFGNFMRQLYPNLE